MTLLIDDRYVAIKKYCKQCDFSVHGNTKTCRNCGASKFVYLDKTPEFPIAKKVDSSAIQVHEQKSFTQVKRPSRRKLNDGMELIGFLIKFGLLFGFLFLLFGKSLFWVVILPLSILGIVFFYLFWLYGLSIVFFLFFLPFSIGEKYNLKAFTWVLAFLWWILFGSVLASLVEWFWT